MDSLVHYKYWPLRGLAETDTKIKNPEGFKDSINRVLVKSSDIFIPDNIRDITFPGKFGSVVFLRQNRGNTIYSQYFANNYSTKGNEFDKMVDCAKEQFVGSSYPFKTLDNYNIISIASTKRDIFALIEDGESHSIAQIGYDENGFTNQLYLNRISTPNIDLHEVELSILDGEKGERKNIYIYSKKDRKVYCTSFSPTKKVCELMEFVEAKTKQEYDIVAFCLLRRDRDDKSFALIDAHSNSLIVYEWNIRRNKYDRIRSVILERGYDYSGMRSYNIDLRNVAINSTANPTRTINLLLLYSSQKIWVYNYIDSPETIDVLIGNGKFSLANPTDSYSLANFGLSGKLNLFVFDNNCILIQEIKEDKQNNDPRCYVLLSERLRESWFKGKVQVDSKTTRSHRNDS